MWSSDGEIIKSYSIMMKKKQKRENDFWNTIFDQALVLFCVPCGQFSDLLEHWFNQWCSLDLNSIYYISQVSFINDGWTKWRI